VMSSLKLNQLRKLIAEEVKRNLSEVAEKQEDGEDSLDSQIDRYLSDYESESRVSKMEGKDFRMMVRRFLSEAEGDEEKKDEKEPEKLKAEDIDVENFLGSVMRLVDNYDALLEVRNTILRRAVNFLVKGYEPAVAEAFKDNLLDVYGMELGKSKSEVEDDEFQAPAADRAGTSPGA
jgi:hypothetical protein